MTLETVTPPTSILLPGAASAAITELVDRVKPGVVQVVNGGHGGGAGVIWRADGRILTNHHVVARDGAPVKVLLADERALEARVLDRNPGLDLALLQVEAQDLPAVPVGDSRQLRIGELVLAVGHPWGQRWVVTLGVVSHKGSVQVRDERRGRARRAQYIQSDVRLAPGNSGGPLLNAEGAVIGINAMIFGGDLSVAIPSHVASGWLARQAGPRAVLGVTVQAVELQTPAHLDGQVETVTGLLVSGLQPGGAAERAGVFIGDILLTAGGQLVPDGEALLDALSENADKPTIALSVVRGGAVVALTVAVETENPLPA